MLTYGTTEEAIYQAAQQTGVEIVDLKVNKNSIQFKLRSILQENGNRVYGKRNPLTRHKGIGVCFHGWHEFLRNLWDLCPQARVKTTKGFFDSYAEFMAKLDDLDEEVVVQGQRFRASQACLCGGS